jgi:uncharacterized protein DUF6644
MSLLGFCQWLQDTNLGTALRESQYMFPIVEGAHVLGLAVSVGVIFMVDLRLIGIRMRNEAFSDIMTQLEPWSLAGFVTMFITGGLLFWSEAAKCYHSTAFRYKILFLLFTGINALIFKRTVFPKVAAWDRDASNIPVRARMAGWCGIVLWSIVIAFGRWTAYGLK